MKKCFKLIFILEHFFNLINYKKIRIKNKFLGITNTFLEVFQEKNLINMV